MGLADELAAGGERAIAMGDVGVSACHIETTVRQQRREQCTIIAE